MADQEDVTSALKHGNGLLAALSFLTPLGGGRHPEPSALDWFSVVGAGIGAVLGGLWWAARLIWPAQVAAAIVVVADGALTGFLHLDGLADSADGLLPPLSRERRREVMADPRTGAFGVAALVLVLIARWAALSALHPSALLLAGLWGSARAVMAWSTRKLPYASRPGGIASSFISQGRRGALWPVLGVLGALALCLAWKPLPGGCSFAAGLLIAAAVLAFGVRKLGGFSGDVLGAAGVMAETVGLLVAAARW